jgi:dTDP-4-amino-4,6-dideoxygalactose transaminase
MINTYEVNFKIKELISAFFKSSKNKEIPLDRLNYKYEITSGRDAIYIIFKDILQKNGFGEVICPNYSCKAIPRAIISVGFNPVFVDVDESMSLDIHEVRKAINENTKAILFYHPWGFLHSKEIVNLAKKNKILLIEDCAQTIGQEVGNLGDYSFFSFRTSKLLGVGSGAILFSKENIRVPIIKAKKIVSLIDFLDLIFRSKIVNNPKLRAILERTIEGISNRRIGYFERNLLVEEFKKIDAGVKKRIENYELLKKTVQNTKNFKNIDLGKAISPLYFPVLCEKKDYALKLFKKFNINAQGFYLHINSDFFNYKFFGKENSLFLSKNLINLPLHEKLNVEELEHIKNSIIKIDKII